MPLPGTTPPVAKPVGPVAPAPLDINPPANDFNPLKTFIPAMRVSIGISGLRASATLISADARESAVLAIIWNVGLSVVALMRARNSSLTLVILTAKAS